MAMSPAERVAKWRREKRIAHEDDAFARTLHVLGGTNPDEFPSAAARAAQMYYDDATTKAYVRSMTTKAASAPADTTTSGWASDLSLPRPGPVLESLENVGQIFQLATQVNLSGVQSIIYPKRAAARPSTDVQWIAQGAGIGARNLAFNPTVLGPVHKLGSITAATRELVNASDGKHIISLMVKEDLAASCDTSLWSSAAATADRPPGLLNGLTAISATAGGGTDAMFGDFEKIAGTITAAGSSGDGLVYVCSPRQFVSAKLRLGQNHPLTILSSPNLANGVVAGIDPRALLVGIGSLRVEASEQTTFVQESSPQQIHDAGGTAAGSTVSAWQIDAIAFRVLLSVTWTMRADGFVAMITGATWGLQ
jgi:hypothetical protein